MVREGRGRTTATLQLKMLACLALLLLARPTAALDNGLGRTPALGWSSWNYFVRAPHRHVSTGGLSAALMLAAAGKRHQRE